MSGIIAQNVGRHTGLVKAAAAGGEWTLIQTQTASASATISFTSGIDSTYDEYCFKFINIHPQTDATEFLFNGSVDTGSNYNVSKTTTYFHAYVLEADGSSNTIAYHRASDFSSTVFQRIVNDRVGNGNDENTSGWLYLLAPSNTTFQKHFMSHATWNASNDYVQNSFMGGYFNDTSAVDAIQFKMSSDEIQGGSISLYGIG